MAHWSASGPARRPTTDGTARADGRRIRPPGPRRTDGGALVGVGSGPPAHDGRDGGVRVDAGPAQDGRSACGALVGSAAGPAARDGCSAGGPLVGAPAAQDGRSAAGGTARGDAGGPLVGTGSEPPARGDRSAGTLIDAGAAQDGRSAGGALVGSAAASPAQEGRRRGPGRFRGRAGRGRRRAVTGPGRPPGHAALGCLLGIGASGRRPWRVGAYRLVGAGRLGAHRLVRPVGLRDPARRGSSRADGRSARHPGATRTAPSPCPSSGGSSSARTSPARWPASPARWASPARCGSARGAIGVGVVGASAEPPPSSAEASGGAGSARRVARPAGVGDLALAGRARGGRAAPRSRRRRCRRAAPGRPAVRRAALRSAQPGSARGAARLLGEDVPGRPVSVSCCLGRRARGAEPARPGGRRRVGPVVARPTAGGALTGAGGSRVADAVTSACRGARR